MKRSAFPVSPLPVELPATAADPWLTLAAFALLTLTVGLAWTPAQLLPAIVGTLLYLLWPAPPFRSWRTVLGFLPLLLLLPLFHALNWVGLADGRALPWRHDASGWARGLQLSLRLGLWIVISARSLERLHPAALMARLPRRERLARRMLAPLLALSWLELSFREAWFLERAWRARGGRAAVAAGRWRGVHWPSLILPLFRNLLARGDTLAEALTMRRFPQRWAGAPRSRRGAGDFVPALGALVLLLVTLWIRDRGV